MLQYICASYLHTYTRILRAVEMEVQGGAGAEGPVLQAFTESAEVLGLLGNLPSVVSELHTRENAEQRFTGRFACIPERGV